MSQAVIAKARKPGGVLAIALESSASLPSAAEEEESADEEDSKQLSLSETPQASRCTGGFAGGDLIGSRQSAVARA